MNPTMIPRKTTRDTAGKPRAKARAVRGARPKPASKPDADDPSLTHRSLKHTASARIAPITKQTIHNAALAILIRNITVSASSCKMQSCHLEAQNPPSTPAATWAVARNTGRIRITDRPAVIGGLNGSLPTLIPQRSSGSHPRELGRGDTGRGCGRSRPLGGWHLSDSDQLGRNRSGLNSASRNPTKVSRHTSP
jgi:hypothetical protein